MTDQAKVDTCYAMDGKEALECIKGFVQTASGPCRPKLVLLTQENCIPCSKEKATHKKAIDEGLIQVLDVSTPEGAAIVSKNKVEFLPSLLLLDCEDKIIYPSD